MSTFAMRDKTTNSASHSAFDRFDQDNMEVLRNDFDTEFDEKYGFCLPGEPIEIVNLSVTGVVAQPKPDIEASLGETASEPKNPSRGLV